MKRRARRPVIGAAALVAVIVAVLVVANWGTVRDHLEAWHFQLTRETATIEPGPKTAPASFKGVALPLAGQARSSESRASNRQSIHRQETSEHLVVPAGAGIGRAGLLEMLANYSERAVICEKSEEYGVMFWIRDGQTVGGADVVQLLNDDGCRLLEQRFPRRAYVVVRDDGPLVGEQLQNP